MWHNNLNGLQSCSVRSADDQQHSVGLYYHKSAHHFDIPSHNRNIAAIESQFTIVIIIQR